MRKDIRFRWAGFLIALGTAWTAGPPAFAAEEPLVSVVMENTPGPAASHGLEKLIAALKGKGASCERCPSPADARGKFLIAAGLAGGDGLASRLLKEGNHPVPQGPEALVIRRTQWKGKPVCVIIGSDDRGLMYAALDVADRVGWSVDPGTPFSEVRDTVEKPGVSERAL